MRRPSARKRAPPAPRSAARAPTASSTAELHHLGSRIEIYYAKENLWYGADVLEVKSVRGQYSRLRARYDGLPVLVELLVFVVLGFLWMLPLRFVFVGVGRADPDEEP